MAVFFMANISTILLYLTSKEVRDTLDVQEQKEFSSKFLKAKMSEYEVVYQSIIDNFNIDMFG